MYDAKGNECAKFKDLKYAYDSAISPDGKIFVVKSTDGRLAVYSLKTLSLIKKFRYSKVDGAQDDGYCFTGDSKYFINVERHIDSLHNAVSWYNTENFEREYYLQLDDSTQLSEIEQSKDGVLYVLGSINNDSIVGVINNDGIEKTVTISLDEFWYYQKFFTLKRGGFTVKQCESIWLDDSEIEKMKNSNISLEKLFSKYKNKECG